MSNLLKKITDTKNSVTIIFIGFLCINAFVFIFIKQPENDDIGNKNKTPFPVYDSNGINVFTKKIESHLIDYLPFKYNYIGFSNYLKINLFHSFNPKNNVIVGKHNWLFLNSCIFDDLGMNEYGGYNPWSNEQLNKAVENITTISNWCKKNGIKFELVLCPNKQSIYDNYLPNTFSQNRPTRYDQIITALPNIINLKKILLEYKTTQAHSLYYKTDTHWNELGAYIATKEISKRLALNEEQNNALQQFQIKDSVMYHGLDLANALALKKHYTDTFTKIKFPIKKFKKIPRLVIVHDSYIESMMPSLHQIFDTIDQKQLYNDGIPSPNYLIEHKTDVFIIELVERYKELLTWNIHPDYYK